MSETMEQFVRDLQTVLGVYKERLANDAEGGDKEARACLQNAQAALQAADAALAKALDLAAQKPDRPHLIHQTLGIVQQVESSFNARENRLGLAAQIEELNILAKRFLEVLDS